MREQELRCSAAVLGIHKVVFLDYRDSGMASASEYEDPRAFVNAQADEVVSKLVRIMREIRPQVVITFDPYGGYGHPDHIAVHQQTLAVFKAGGDHSRYPEQGEIWQPASLFYDVFPHSLFSNMRLRMEEMDIDVSQFDNSEDLIRAGWPDEEVHVTIDVSSQTQVKRKAFDCNWTQFIAENPLFQLSEPELENILSHEHFVCALPELFPVDRFTDLFWSS